MKPSKLVANNGFRLTICLGEFLFQDGKPLSIIDEGDTTELVASSTGNYTQEQEVFMAYTREDQYHNIELSTISADENTADSP